MSASLPLFEIQKKLEYYCSYQERCHQEVEQKLFSFQITQQERNQIIVSLINDNYLNEERFSGLFTLSKLHQKKWGKTRIRLELKARKISDYLITKSIREILDEEYNAIFEALSEKHWESLILEKNQLKKRKKFCDYLLRKGWESDLVYAKLNELSK